MKNSRFVSVSIMTSFLLVLSACGGGGGSDEAAVDSAAGGSSDVEVTDFGEFSVTVTAVAVSSSASQEGSVVQGLPVLGNTVTLVAQ